MIEMAKTDKNNWVRCCYCGHKLGRAVGGLRVTNQAPRLEIKCHSCKHVVAVGFGVAQDQGQM